MSLLEDLNRLLAGSKVRELAFEAGSPYDVIVDPVVITSTRLTHQKTMEFESMLIQPNGGYLPMLFSATCEHGNDVTFVKPFVQYFKCVRVRFTGRHALRFLVRDIITDGTIDINQVVLDAVFELRADQSSLFVPGLMESAVHEANLQSA